MENGGTSLTNLVNDVNYRSGQSTASKQKMTILNYKSLSYSHPSKRPVQSIGASTQDSSISMMEQQSRQQVVSVQQVMQNSPQPLQHSPQPLQHSPQQHDRPLQNLQHSLYTDKQKMVLQLQRDPKTGVLMLNNNNNNNNDNSNTNNSANNSRAHNLMQVPVASHGYHPGRHLHHRLQLKHTPQNQEQDRHIQNRMVAATQPAAQRQQYPAQTYENSTYTRTYPQTNTQTYQYATYTPQMRPVVRTRLISPNHPQYQQILAQQVRPVIAQRAPHFAARTQVLTSQPRYTLQTSSQAAVKTEKLSHFDYGEQDLTPPPSSSVYARSTDYQRTIENEDKSTLQVTTASVYSPAAYSGRHQTTQIMRQVPQRPPVLTTQSSFTPQPSVISQRLSRSESATLQPVILTAQQAGQTMRPSFQSNPVVLQINGGKNIRGSIVTLNNAPQQQVAQVAQSGSGANSTHVYFTLPQGNNVSTAKFIKTPNGHLKSVNGLQNNSLNQSKMYTVRYAVSPKPEEGKVKQQYAIYSPVNTSAKVASPKSEKILLPKTHQSSPDPTRKRKPTSENVSSAPDEKQTPPNKLTRIEPKTTGPSGTRTDGPSPGHSELLQRVSKSLEADKDVVQRPDTHRPFDSYTDAFRKLMKYHIYFEADCKESYLRKVDRTHEEVSKKLVQRKANLINKFHHNLIDKATQQLPAFQDNSDMVTLLTNVVVEEKEALRKVKEELATLKQQKLRDSQKSPDPEGPLNSWE